MNEPAGEQVQSSAQRKARTRVVLFTNSVLMGGMERHVELLARLLDRRDFEVFTICPDWPAIAPFDDVLAQVADHHRRCTPDRRRGFFRQVQEALTLYRLLRSWRIDVLHMHLTTFAGGTWALAAARLAGVRVVICTEHLAPEQPVGRATGRLRTVFTHALDQLVCVSEKNRTARARYLDTPSERTSVVVNGVDTDRFVTVDAGALAALRQDLGIPAHAPVAGSVVRLAPDKGLEYLLQAMSRVLVRCPDAYLLLVGDGPLRSALETQAAALGIRHRVIFAGFQADPVPYLAMLDAFVLPVPVGSMSIGLLEAMGMGRPAVITFGGIGEAVIHGETGLCAPPRDPAALAEAMTRLLSDPLEARRLGDAARRHVEEHFSAAQVARRLAQLYATLLRTRARLPYQSN